MDDKTLYTKILGLEPPWFITEVAVKEKQNRVDIRVAHEPGIRVRCPVCDKFCGVYDHSPERVYRHLDTCQMRTFIHVRLPRVNCPDHGVKRIDSEFGENGSDMTFAFESFVIRVVQECSMEASSRLCGLSWDRCWNVLTRAVNRGRERKDLRVPDRIGVDEKSIARGHKYETLVYDIDAATVEYVSDDRKEPPGNKPVVIRCLIRHRMIHQFPDNIQTGTVQRAVIGKKGEQRNRFILS